MKKEVIITMLLLLVYAHAFSTDLLIKGKLINEKEEPIPFANIGILNKDIGTTSLENGEFRIIIPEKYLTENLTFASLGYKRKNIPVYKLKGNSFHQIVLKEETIFLDEVRVSSKKIKMKKTMVGPNPAGNLRVNINSSDHKGGAAFALLIDPKPQEFHLKNIRLNISENTYNEAKLRIRLFEAIETLNTPGKDIINKNIIVKCAIEKGWLTIDMEKYDINLKQDKFFLAVELIEDWNIRKLQDIEDSTRLVHYKKLYDRGAKGIQQITKNKEGNKKVTGYVAKNKGVKSLNKSLKQAGVKSSPRTFFRVNSRNAAQYPCYSRTASFGNWNIEPFTLVAKVLIEHSK